MKQAAILLTKEQMADLAKIANNTTIRRRADINNMEEVLTTLRQSNTVSFYFTNRNNGAEVPFTAYFKKVAMSYISNIWIMYRAETVNGDDCFDDAMDSIQHLFAIHSAQTNQ